MHNENKLNEMPKILLGLNKYVPVHATEKTIEINGNVYTQPATELSPRLLFGDQLTSARVYEVQLLCNVSSRLVWIILRDIHQLPAIGMHGYVSSL